MPTLKDQLILHESERLKPYTDTVGKLTIGVGRNLTDKGISHTTSMQMLDEDIAECEKDLKTFPWFPTLDPIRQRVLLDMRFNLGVRGFRTFRTVLLAVAAGDYGAASQSMLGSLWARQTKTRATRLAEMMRTGVDYA